MYTEDKETKSFDVKGFIIKVILIILFVLLLMWLLPLGKDNGNVNPLLDNLFSENIIKMKESAINYYTLERLPVNVGDKKVLTLKEMQDMKLLTPFVDKNGKTCDIYNSYVEITKKDNEYILKTNLKCSDKEDYVVVHLGCYDYCKTYICENKKPEEDKKPIIPDKPIPGISYIYEYSKWFGASYSDWSNWSSDKPYKVGEIQFGTTEYSIKEDLGVKHVLVGYKTAVDKSKPLFRRSYVKVGTSTEKLCKEYGYYADNGVVYQETPWTYQGIVTSKTFLDDTSTTKYVPLGLDYECAGCTSSPNRKWEKYTRTLASVGTSGNVTVKCKDYETKTVDVYTTKLTWYAYEETRTAVYGDVHFYRERTRTLKNIGYTDIKWSYYNDRNLIDAKYGYTGNKKVK